MNNMSDINKTIDDLKFLNALCHGTVLDDAIALLKGKDPRPQRYKEHDIFHLAFCPNEKCDGGMKPEWHFCPYCGTACEWDYELEEKMFSDWNRSIKER